MIRKTLNATDLGGCLVKLFGLPFLCIGLWMTVSMAQGLYFGFAFEDWRQIEGTAHRPEDGSFFEPNLEFSYEFEGRSYRTDRLSYGAVAKSSSFVLKTYEDGATVELWLDPERPSRAVLLPPDQGATLGISALGLTLTVIGGLLCFARARNR